MAPVVVDTNVAVVADGRGSGSPNCVTACVRRLREIERSGAIVIDNDWEIIGEYVRNLQHGGRVGHHFLMWVLDNRTNPDRCAYIALTPDAARGFAEFPDDPRLTMFDRADRKFVAVARAHQDKPPILQALDSEWWGHRQALLDNGVTVEFLCPTEISALHARKHGTP